MPTHYMIDGFRIEVVDPPDNGLGKPPTMVGNLTAFQIKFRTSASEQRVSIWHRYYETEEAAVADAPRVVRSEYPDSVLESITAAR